MPSASASHYTTKFENTHRIVRREILYRLHPWFGRHVFVHEVVNKAAASSVFRCTFDGSEIARYLEIPAWMFDRAACAGDGHFAVEPSVSLEALNALSILLNQVLKNVAPSLNVHVQVHVEAPTNRIGEKRVTENTTAPPIGKRHKRRIAAKQMDLFASEAVGTPSWLDLPDEVRELLIGLMTRWMLDHVQTAMLPAKVVGGGDEH